MSAMLTAFVMLYFRLPDSIRAGVCRSAHDCYVHEKIKLKKWPAAVDSESTSNVDESDEEPLPPLRAHQARRKKALSVLLDRAEHSGRSEDDDGLQPAERVDAQAAGEAAKDVAGGALMRAAHSPKGSPSTAGGPYRV